MNYVAGTIVTMLGLAMTCWNLFNIYHGHHFSILGLIAGVVIALIGGKWLQGDSSSASHQ